MTLKDTSLVEKTGDPHLEINYKAAKGIVSNQVGIDKDIILWNQYLSHVLETLSEDVFCVDEASIGYIGTVKSNVIKYTIYIVPS